LRSYARAPAVWQCNGKFGHQRRVSVMNHFTMMTKIPIASLNVNQNT